MLHLENSLFLAIKYILCDSSGISQRYPQVFWQPVYKIIREYLKLLIGNAEYIFYTLKHCFYNDSHGFIVSDISKFITENIKQLTQRTRIFALSLHNRKKHVTRKYK